MQNSFLIISGHDFRSRRKANLHFIAEELLKKGPARFFSLGFSTLSKIKRDPRLSLWDRANTVENYNGVDCYLWRTLLHPFNLRAGLFESLEAAWFKAYVRSAPDTLRQWIKESDVILIESGIGVALFDLIKQIRPEAKVIYIVSDALKTIGCAEFLSSELAKVGEKFDAVCLTSPLLTMEFSSRCRLFHVPHGIDQGIADIQTVSPYPAGIHLVSVGSMLFDRNFFELASGAMPEVTFHIIGGGAGAKGLSASNIRVYDEMAFKDTIAYIRYSHAGIAPYEGRNVVPYLVDTSMKLMQYGFLGIPAICPQTVVGGYPGRFGYEPGDRASIESAIARALKHGHFPGHPYQSWQEVTDRILSPEKYNDTRISKELQHA